MDFLRWFIVFLPFIVVFVYLVYPLIRRHELSTIVFVVSVVVSLSILIITLYPVGDISMLFSPFEEETTGIPNDYLDDYIYINDVQEKMIIYHINITGNAVLQYHVFPIYFIETYDFNYSDMKFHKSQHNLESVNFSMTFAKKNFSYTVYPRWNTSNSCDLSRGFFPLVNNDIVTVTYRMDTHNLSSEFNQTVFLFPFKPHTEEIGNYIPKDTPQNFIDTVVIAMSVVGFVCFLVVFIFYLYMQQQQHQRARQQANEYWLNFLQRYRPTRRLQGVATEQMPNDIQLPSRYADYRFGRKTSRENLQKNIDYFRDQGYWTKIINVSPEISIVYISNWKQNQVGEYGIPEWRRTRQRQST